MKRPDIQGIRGLAIAAVLAFHLNDVTFPAGFIGVDIFFVLSGYLMTVILAKEAHLNMTVFRKFYTRRFKRIVPMYAVLIVALAILVPCILLRRDVVKFCQHVLWAAAFATNIQVVLEEKDYFTELYDSNVLTHTWSLGVEIQYYLIVPFIVLAQRKLSQKCEQFPFFLVLLLASLSFQLFSSPEAAFNLLPARVWQFLAGGLAYELSPIMNEVSSTSSVQYKQLSIEEHLHIDEDGKTEEHEPFFCKSNLTADLISLVLFVLVLSPWTLFPAHTLRIAAVGITSGLLVLGYQEDKQGFLLTNRLIVYLGDISYIVYLAHWPVIIMWKSVTDSAMTPYGVMFCLVITFVISILVHHTVEQYFIRSKTKSAIIAVSFLYGLLAVGLLFNVPLAMNDEMGVRASTVDIDNAIKWNEQVSHNGYKNKMPFKECMDDPESRRMRGGFKDTVKNFECVWKRKNVTGSLEILVLGNSIAQIATNILKSIIEKNFPQVSLMRLVAMPGKRITELFMYRMKHGIHGMRLLPALNQLCKEGRQGWNACYPIEVTNHKTCAKFFKTVPNLVKAMKPNITFVIYDDTKRLNTLIVNATDDIAMKEYIDFLQPIVNSSQFTIVDEIYPRPPGNLTGMGLSMQKRLMRNQPLNDLKVSFETFKAQYASYFSRLDLLQFPNLIRHNTSAAICAEEKGWCWWYNRRNLHAYFTDHTHFTTDGLELVRESYTKILKDVIERLTK